MTINRLASFVGEFEFKGEIEEKKNVCVNSQLIVNKCSIKCSASLSPSVVDFD